jgi:hypothetical protein
MIIRYTAMSLAVYVCTTSDDLFICSTQSLGGRYLWGGGPTVFERCFELLVEVQRGDALAAQDRILGTNILILPASTSGSSGEGGELSFGDWSEDSCSRLRLVSNVKNRLGCLYCLVADFYSCSVP